MFQIDELVTIYSKIDLYKVIAWDGNLWCKVENTRTGEVMLVNTFTIKKYVKYHHIWNKICQK